VSREAPKALTDPHAQERSGLNVVLFIFVLVVRPVAFRALRVSWPGSYRNTKAQK